MTRRRFGIPEVAMMLAVAAGFATAACTGGNGVEDALPTAEGRPLVQVGRENIVIVKPGTMVVGPMISGELRPAREATVRAELGGSVLSVEVEEGQPVRRGMLLGRIDARSLGDARQSAASAVRSAESQLAVAQREEERTKQLVAAGAVAQRDADVARGNVAAAEAALADARSRLASAETSLADAVIRSPLNGIVASRVVNAGDVVTAGAELFTIIDPSSMRLEAAVPARDLRALRPGASVRFSIRGYDESFDGRIERIGPRADAATGQVPIFVTIMNANGRLIAGLFAEGRVATESADGLVVPMNAVNTAGDTPWVVRVTNGVAEKIPVTIGLRDPHTETLQIVSGVNQGDILLRGAAQGITPGTPVQVGAED